MLNSLRRMFCRHEWVWSERRRKEVCYRCRQARRPVEDGPVLAQATSFNAPTHTRRNSGTAGTLLPGRQAPIVEPTPPDEGPRTEWDFGTLNSQRLNHAKVRDGQGT